MESLNKRIMEFVSDGEKSLGQILSKFVPRITPEAASRRRRFDCKNLEGYTLDENVRKGAISLVRIAIRRLVRKGELSMVCVDDEDNQVFRKAKT